MPEENRPAEADASPTVNRAPERWLFRGLIVCILLVFAVLARPLFLGTVYVNLDLAWLVIPTHAFYQECLISGEEFTWNPAMQCGYYEHAGGLVGYHPLRMFLFRFFSLGAATNLEILLNYPFALLGLYLFLRRWKLPPIAALFGGFVFAFGGFNLAHMFHVNVVFVVVHIPWLLLAADLCLREADSRSRACGALGIALLTSSQLLSGFPQAVIFSTMIETLYILFLSGRVFFQNGKVQKHAFRILLLGGLAIALGKLLAALLGAVQILPTLSFLHETERANPTSMLWAAYSLHPSNMMQFIGPYFFKTWVSMTHMPNEASLYNGVAPTLLTLWIAIRRKALRPYRGIILTTLFMMLLFLLFALGSFGPVYGHVVELIPLLKSFRAPARYISLVHLTMAIASGFACMDLLRICRHKRPVAWRVLWPLVLPVLIGWAIFLFFNFKDDGVAAWINPYLVQDNDYLTRSTQLALSPLLMTLAALLLLFAARGKHLALLLLLCMGVVDQAGFGMGTFANQPPLPMETFLEEISQPPALEPGQRYLGRNNNMPMLHGMDNSRGYIGPHLKRKLTYDYKHPEVMRLTNTAWYNTRKYPPPIGTKLQWKPVRNPLPRVRLVCQTKASANPAADLKRIDAAKVALLDEAVPLPPGTPGIAELVERKNTFMRIRTECKTRQLLVITESKHVGWKLQINGVDAPLLDAYGDFMACVVEPGVSDVQLRFVGPGLYWGKRLSLLGLLLSMALLALCLRKPRARCAQEDTLPEDPLAIVPDDPSPQKPIPGARFLVTLFHPVAESRRKKLLYATLLLVICLLSIALTYNYVIEQGPENMRGRYDVYRYFGPQLFFFDYSLQHHGMWPQWCQLTYCGIPIGANPQSLYFYPPNVLRALLHTEPTPQGTQVGFIWMLGAHFVLIFLSTHALARAHGMSRMAALAAAFAFTFSSLMVRRAGEYHFITTLAWAPLLLLLCKKLLDAPAIRNKLAFAAGVGSLLTLSFLGGFTQVVPYVGVLVVGYCLCYRVLFPPKNAIRGRWFTDIGSLATAPMLTVRLSAALLLPLWELATYTGRTQGTAVGAYSNLLAQGPIKLFLDFILFGGIRYEAEALRGAGVIALLLAFVSLSHPRRRLIALFGALYLILLDCSFGPPFPIAFITEKLTPFANSAHSRAYDVALLPLALLGGLGVDALAQPLKRRRGYIGRSLLILIPGICVLPTLYYCFNPETWLPDALSALIQQYLGKTKMTGIWLPVTHWVVTLPVIGFVLMLLTLRSRKPRLLCLLLPLLLFGETLAWNVHYVPDLGRKPFAGPKENLDDSQRMPQDNHRDTDPIQSNALYGLRNFMNGYDPLHLSEVRDVMSGGGRANLYMRAVRSWEPTIENVRGNLFLKRPFWLSRQWQRGAVPDKYTLWPAATTAFLPEATPGNVPQVPAGQLGTRGVSLNALKTPLKDPRFFSATRPVGKAAQLRFTLPKNVPDMPQGSAGAVQSVLFLAYKSTGSARVDVTLHNRENGHPEEGKRFDIRATNGAEKWLQYPLPDFHQGTMRFKIKPSGRGKLYFTQGYTLSDLNDEDGLIRITDRDINYITLELDNLPGPRILKFLDADYPGWKAYVDKKEVPLFRVDDAFKGIEVAAGSHKIRFQFQSTYLRTGIALSSLGILIALTAMLFLPPRRKKTAKKEESTRQSRRDDIIIETQNNKEENPEGVT
jgi:hypothetical protein